MRRLSNPLGSLWPHSIRGRLIVTMILSQLLLAAGLLFTGVFYTYKQHRATLDEQIQAHAMSVAALVRYNEDASGNVYFDNTLVPPSIDPDRPDLFAVWTERSGLLARSSNWPAGLEIDMGGRDHRSFTWAEVPYRVRRISHVQVLDRETGATFRPQTLTIIYAAPMNHVRQEVQEAGFFIAVASLLLAGSTVLLALWGIRRGLIPLQQLAGQAGLISTKNWQMNLPEEVRRVDELQPLTESMTTMLTRLERSFSQQREFLGNAAHELKTPVAVLKSTLQSLLHRPRSPEEYCLGVGRALEDLDRLEELLQWMMRLARAEQWAHGGLRRDLQVIDVAATCEEAVERIRSLAESSHTKIQFTPNDKVQFRADPEDLQLVWTNLLENAVRYSPPGGSVEVAIHRENGGPAQIVFQDHGVGIAPADLPHVFERFYRGDPSRTRSTGGYGLGLAIAKALIEAYGGTIRAESAPGEGTRMTVELPVGPSY